MSEYQRYEFMTCDQPLTRAQLDEVNDLSSHIEASPAHAIIEYHWGDFKHNPIEVLYKFFDGFLYWANWGSPELAFRFPHGVLPANLLEDYDDLADFITFTQHPDYDLLDIHFKEMDRPDEWVNYELAPLISIRNELMDGDLRALYIVWLAGMHQLESYDEEEDYEISSPPVPPTFGKLTVAQQALTELLQVPRDLLAVATRHSKASTVSMADDFSTWITLLPEDRRNDYLLRLAHNEPGLSRLLIKELRARNQGSAHTTPLKNERVSYATLLAEYKAVLVHKEHEDREHRKKTHEEYLLRLRGMYENQDDYWDKIEQALARRSGAGYDEAVCILVRLRDIASNIQTDEDFQRRFTSWVQPHLSRPALIRRLKDHKFALPEI
jgi:hypothetical protein